MKKPLVVLLAGGIGKNFQPLVTNKTCFPFMGKAMVLHILDQLVSAGLTSIVCASNQQNHQMLQSHPNVLQTCIVEHPTGMHAGLLALKKHISDTPILVVNAVDTIETYGIESFLNAIEDQYALLMGKIVQNHQPAGYFELTNDRLVRIVEKPQEGAEPSNMVNLIFHYFLHPAELLSLIEKHKDTDTAYESVINTLAQSHEIKVFSYEGEWNKLKYPFHVLDMMNTFLSTVEKHISKSAHIHESAIIEGNVWIDENVLVDEYAVIKGPTYIGNGARIGNHAFVRQSMVEEQATVGFGSEVARSYIGKQSMLHHNFIGDCVLEGNVNPSWGTTTANYRLDKESVEMKLPNGTRIDSGKDKLGVIFAKDVFCGVNCSIMPGVTLSQGTKILPGSIVYDSQ